jgi:probable phosphoglycerate mutase
VRLNDRGRAEVRALAEKLSERGVSAIYSSPLDRARETAALLGERLRLDPRVCDEAAEIRFGEWTGRDFTDLASDPDFQRWNQFRSAARAPGGESMLQVQARMVAALQRLCGEHPAEAVLLVSHGDVIKAAVAYFTGIPIDLMQRFEITPCSLSEIEVHEDGALVRCINYTATR